MIPQEGLSAYLIQDYFPSLQQSGRLRFFAWRIGYYLLFSLDYCICGEEEEEKVQVKAF